MKKTRIAASLLACTLAATCALGFAACGDDDDASVGARVTEEQWRAALALTPADNAKVTLKAQSGGMTLNDKEYIFVFADGNKSYVEQDNSINRTTEIREITVNGKTTSYGKNNNGEWSSSTVTDATESFVDNRYGWALSEFTTYAKLYDHFSYDEKSKSYKAPMADVYRFFMANPNGTGYSETGEAEFKFDSKARLIKYKTNRNLKYSEISLESNIKSTLNIVYGGQTVRPPKM